MAHRSELIQVVRRYPDRQIVLGKAMGRSAYLCPTLRCIQLAQKKNRMGRALKAPVPMQLYEALAEQVIPADPEPG